MPSSVQFPSLPLAFSLAVGAVGVTAGCTALTKTTGPGFARRFGLPDPASWYHFMGAMGARNVASGLSVIAFGWRREWSAVGTVLLCGTVTGLVDTIITWKHGLRQASYGHLLSTLVFGTAGWWLLGAEEEGIPLF